MTFSSYLLELLLIGAGSGDVSKPFPEQCDVLIFDLKKYLSAAVFSILPLFITRPMK